MNMCHFLKMSEKDGNADEQTRKIPPPVKPPVRKPPAVSPKGFYKSTSRESFHTNEESDDFKPSKLISNIDNTSNVEYNYTPLPPYRQGYQEKNEDLAFKLAKQNKKSKSIGKGKRKHQSDDFSDITTESRGAYSENHRDKEKRFTRRYSSAVESLGEVRRRRVKKIRILSEDGVLISRKVDESEQREKNENSHSPRKIKVRRRRDGNETEQSTQTEDESRNDYEKSSKKVKKGSRYERESSDSDDENTSSDSESEQSTSSESSESGRPSKKSSGKTTNGKTQKISKRGKSSSTIYNKSSLDSKNLDSEKKRSKSTAKYTNIRNKNTTSSNEQDEIDEIMEEEDALIEIIYLFNSNPKANIVKFCDFFGKKATPENIAELLYKTKGLVGNVIGDYLSRKENEVILKAYFKQLNLKTDFISAMRTSLGGPLYLPGEAQMIDRVVQAFSECYIQQNPGSFSVTENAYVLSFALIMLNSDLHNPNVQRRMSVDQFIRNTKASLSSGDLSDEELTKMYNQLKETPFKFSATSNEFLAMSAPKLKGFLQMKMKKKFAKITKHYFVLVNSCMYYFKDDSQLSKDQPQGMIQLTEVDVQADEKTGKTKIELIATNQQIQIVTFEKGIPNVVTNIKSIEFEGPDEESTQKWLQRIKKSIIISCFNDQPGSENDFNDTDNVSDAEE